MSDYLDPNNEELLKDFFMEAQLQVDTLEQNILVLENDPASKEAVDEIFRAAHTLKGGAATVQMSELSGFTHVVEDVLDDIRSGKIVVSEEAVDTLLDAIDIIKAMLEARSNGSVYSEDISATKGALQAILTGKTGTKKQPTAAKKQKDVPPAKNHGLTGFDYDELKEALSGSEKLILVTVSFDESNPMNSVGGIQIFSALKELGQVLKTDPEFEALYEDVYHPVVKYFIGSEDELSRIKEKATIPDVVTNVDVVEITDIGQDSGGGVAQEAPKQSKAAKKKEQQSESGQAPAGSRKDAAAQDVQSQDESDPAVETEENPEDALRAQDQMFAAKGPAKSKTVSSSVLRVDSSRIDDLLNSVSEAVINKATFNQISNQFTETQIEFQNTELTYKERLKDLFEDIPVYFERLHKGEALKEIRREMNEAYGDLFGLFDAFESKFKGAIAKFRNTSQNLGRLTGELHEKVLQIRMVPISHIFSRFPRLVRDVSKNLNKKINLVIEGEDTELDKSVIEDLLDPLIHCVRNSVDHGIEMPEEREALMKEPEGTVLLTARNEGNMIIIEVADDGKGIDVETVREKAIKRGIIHPNKALSDIEAFNLIFEAGFSTAKSITNISGRGVGLDVVKKQIEKLNGSVSVWSEKGIGTKLTIKLPLTLAIIQGLLVKVGEEVYTIPITSVIDSHRIRPDEIKLIDNYEVFDVRDDVVSLIRLNHLFKIQTDGEKDYHFVVIVGSGDKKMGLMVDSMIGEEDVVIKPLKDQYTNSPGIAGATILGDGTVSLIIDVSQLLELGFRTEKEDRKKREATIR
ncbi:MAG: chemotaxis protein CheA [Spirochaetales bacterium]|nr:chemotaxis protein CheA [Spirochaetales bacterium]